jgi:hypothetical protein
MNKALLIVCLPMMAMLVRISVPYVLTQGWTRTPEPWFSVTVMATLWIAWGTLTVYAIFWRRLKPASEKVR